MADETTSPNRRRGLRFSLLTLVWLLTVVAAAVGIWKTGKEVVPLREEVARVRKELGYFPIDEPTKIQIRRIRSKVPNAWQWRIYLPSSRPYALNYFYGRSPDLATMPKDQWCAMLRALAPSQGVARSQPFAAGESSFEALLTKYGGHWWLRYGQLNEDGQTVSLAPRDKWLSDETAWVAASDVPYGRVANFDPAKPVVLLHVEQSVHADGEQEPDEGSGAGERLIIWLEPQ